MNLLDPSVTHTATFAGTLITALGGPRLVRALLGRGREKARADLDEAKAESVRAEADQASLNSLQQLLVLYQTQLVQQGGRLDREVIKGEEREKRIAAQDHQIATLRMQHMECERREEEGKAERHELADQIVALKQDLDTIKAGQKDTGV